MPTLEVYDLEQQIARLAQCGYTDKDAGQAITAHSDRIDDMHRRIDAMPNDVALDATQTLYTGFEKIIQRFELIESIECQLGDLKPPRDSERAISRVIPRFARISNAIKSLPETENIAVTILMYQKFDDALAHFRNTWFAEAQPELNQRQMWQPERRWRRN